MPFNDRIIKEPEMCRITGKAPRTVKRWLSEGRLPPKATNKRKQKLGGWWESDIEKWRHKEI